MTLHDYETGEGLRTLTDAEATQYQVAIENDTTHTGAVDGADFGHDGTVYATD